MQTALGVPAGRQPSPTKTKHRLNTDGSLTVFLKLRHRMSLWLRRCDADGEAKHYAILFDPLGLIAIVGIAMGVVLPFIFVSRNLALREPVQTAFTIVSAPVIG